MFPFAFEKFLKIMNFDQIFVYKSTEKLILIKKIISSISKIDPV